MICFPNAKINLGLSIVGKRPDGYHDLETIFYPVPLCDALEIVGAETDSLRCSGMTLDSDSENNLVLKALRSLRKKYTIPPLAVYLRKAIPFGAGLGGGSADAAFMLKLVSEYYRLSVSDDELEEIASGIGADCAFFIRNRPVKASGIGNIFEPIDLSLGSYTLYIVKPDVFVSTKDAYSMVKPSQPMHSLDEIIRLPVSEWKDVLKNDFETSVFSHFPMIGEIKDELYAQGAVYASMSGSGSAVFGLFEHDISLSFPGCFVWKGKTK
ncbi:MAG: 4-(cytidine 5'-diphospho)-2-C-methyl-D-erythritol kinase [Tannerella sp.]|uniref:4-diphosphocytidyl-2-C-methyl-D-erythritol kinase n=1 Tax=Tannerella forsythia (strain ATCC 43037 / JCM 10827 / CCUG 21028 A / KCTC 5666 / FDC 338) TaxID=203275 RepID=G8UNA5_TANFA|nr:4-(cytidine 5'-diphospho)-2-C-methyl-D-erythritol kinase [Tannerella forsythia]AEW20613.1 4-(cytidine 5'-diphospho)-2-C-methyl-D-erythritol kinase [Tannerella forsythia 92A2]